MPFGIIGRTGSWDEAGSGVCKSVHGKGYFWGHIWDMPLYPKMDFTAYVCNILSQPSQLWFGVVRAVGRGTAVLDGGQRSPTGMGGFGVFVLHFHNGKCHCVADGEMFPTRMRKLHNISVRKTYRWKARFVGFWRYFQSQDQILGLEKLAKT